MKDAVFAVREALRIAQDNSMAYTFFLQFCTYFLITDLLLFKEHGDVIGYATVINVLHIPYLALMGIEREKTGRGKGAEFLKRIYKTYSNKPIIYARTSNTRSLNFFIKNNWEIVFEFWRITVIRKIVSNENFYI